MSLESQKTMFILDMTYKKWGYERSFHKYDKGKVHLVKAYFSIKPDEKKFFGTILKNVKLQKGCVSNILRCVEVDEMKISGYKGNDAHFIMHYRLEFVVRKVLDKKVYITLILLGNFFRVICSKL